MKFHDLPSIEERFRKDNARILNPFSVSIPGDPFTLDGLVYKPARTGYYYPTEYAKQRICLHFTAGNLRSDILSLTRQNYHVSVPFVIARDGTIYQLHPSKCWSGHLGKGIGNTGTGNQMDKTTIGIEISNYGLLHERDGNLETIYSRLKNTATGKAGPPDLYCALSEKEAYTRLDTPFRGEKYYPAYTPEQMESTIILLRYLTAKYNIPRKFLPESKRFTPTSEVISFKGIVTHVNFRTSGKWDIGPAFDWAQLMAGVNAEEFKPKYKSAQRSLARPLNEAEVDELFEKDLIQMRSRGVNPEKEEAKDNDDYNPNDYDELPAKEKLTQPSAGKIYALLVGINNYQQVNKLSGCVNDVKKWEKYLNGLSDKTVELKILLNEEATKKNIANAFENHLGQASKTDTVLFFYSGHGTQEDAAEYWQESDDKLECLVCYDGNAADSPEFLMTDKEQRYLLQRLFKKTGAHLVTIFDCCHSGDNTRGRLRLAASPEKARQKFIVTSSDSGAFPRRTWKDFLFGSSMKAPSKKVNINKLFPEAPHISFSACQSNEAALERGREGVFSKNLLTLLNAAGNNVNYRTLESRLKQVMRFTEEQTPKLYAPQLFANALDNGFLNRSLDQPASSAEMTYNAKKGWQLNRGAIHNVQVGEVIQVFESGSASEPVPATVKEVFIDHSSVEPQRALNKKKNWHAMIPNLLLRKIRLQLDNWHGHPADTKALVNEIIQRAGGYYTLEGESEHAGHDPDYSLVLRNAEVIITPPDNLFRPLIRPMLLATEKDVPRVVDALIHMARWHFIKELENQNPQAAFPVFPVDVQVDQLSGKSFRKQSVNNDTVQLKLTKSGENWGGKIRVKLTNRFDAPLYVAALYLDKHFSSMAELIPDSVHLLEAGASVYLEVNGSNELELQLGEQEQQYNWPVITEYIKVIASETVFATDALRLNPLPAPYVLSDQHARGKGLIKVSAPSSKRIDLKKWQTQTLAMMLANPSYNTISRGTLKAMLEYDEMSLFAAGIYYDVVPDEDGQPRNMQLKKGIKVPDDERGIVDDLKLVVANTIETMQRRLLYNRLKNSDRTRIVAEGDSWFQYPILVKDTLDHLYKLYAVRSYAEAGDTLQNYMKKREYLKGLKSEKPVFYLVSGGGNDILGKQFKDFLRSNPDTAENSPAKYLNEDFFKKLDLLQNWYEEMFNEILNLYPNLYILTHSYDYVIPVDTNLEPGKMSWLGKYMIEKGMASQAERKNLIAYMLDLFNEKLIAVVNKHKGRAFYIDVRGLTRDHQWFDEIHPTNEGFASIADQFVEVIESVKKN